MSRDLEEEAKKLIGGQLSGSAGKGGPGSQSHKSFLAKFHFFPLELLIDDKAVTKAETVVSLLRLIGFVRSLRDPLLVKGPLVAPV